MRYLRNWRRVSINWQHSAPKRKVAGGSLIPAAILGLKVGCGNQGMGAKKGLRVTCELEGGLVEMKVSQLA
jgi:hypothetical protein